MNDIGLTLGEAAKYVNRHPRTLQQWDNRGWVPAHRTQSNRRYWLKEELDRFLNRTTAITVKRKVAYCRVSSQAQRPDLKNQREVVEAFCVATGRANVEYISEVGGGLNFKRKEFLKLVDAICSNELDELIVAHKDRLVRFGYELLWHLCSVHGVTLTVINVEKLSPEQEMVQDLMTIIHCFSSRLYSLRNYRKTLKQALK